MLYRYFAELSRYQVEKLAELYHLDLLLFGYSTQVEKRKDIYLPLDSGIPRCC